MSFISCAMVSCQGVMSGLVYRIGISGIGCLSPCDNGYFKTEVLMEGDNWPVFVTQTIDGMNKEAKIYIPSTKQYMKYDEYKKSIIS